MCFVFINTIRLLLFWLLLCWLMSRQFHLLSENDKDLSNERFQRVRHCDFGEVIRFLRLFRRGARNTYQIHRSSLHFNLKKTYRYLQYCLNIDLLELNHTEKSRLYLSKYYRLTEKGRALIELFKDLK